MQALAVAASLLALALPRTGSGGVTVPVPGGWRAFRVAGPIDHVTDPVVRAVVASGPVHLAPRGCQVSTYASSPSAVVIVVVEWRRRSPAGTRWPPRPHRFTARTLPVRPAPAVECFDGPGGAAEFADHGHRLGVYLMAGRRAPPRLVAQARRVLDGLRATGR